MRKFDNYVSNLRVLERADKEEMNNECIISGIIKEAYAVYPFLDGELWLEMLKDRNNMAHVYDGEAAKRLVQRVLGQYIPQFVKLEKELINDYGDALNTI